MTSRLASHIHGCKKWNGQKERPCSPSTVAKCQDVSLASGQHLDGLERRYIVWIATNNKHELDSPLPVCRHCCLQVDANRSFQTTTTAQSFLKGPPKNTACHHVKKKDPQACVHVHASIIVAAKYKYFFCFACSDRVFFRHTLSTTLYS